MRHTLYDNYHNQEDDKKTDPHFILSKILIPFGSLLIAGIPLLTLNYQQLPKWVFISIAVFLILVSTYIILIIGPALKRLSSNLLQLMQKKRNRTRFSRLYLQQLKEKNKEFAKFLEDRNDNVISLVQTVGSWPEILDKQDKFDTYDLEQLGRYAVTLREWLQVVKYHMDNSSASNFQLAAYNFSRLVSQYYRFCLDWHRRFDYSVRQGRIQGEHLRYLKQEWFTQREKITKYIDHWKPLAENINVIFEENICTAYFETLKTIE
jgi:hypothetical protein